MTIWLDSLNVVSLSHLLLFPALHKSCSNLNYLHSTNIGVRFLRLLVRVRLLKLNCCSVTWNVGGLRDNSGRCIRFLYEEWREKAVNAAGNRLKCDLDILTTGPFNCLPRKWVLDYLKFDLYYMFQSQIRSSLAVETLLRDSGVGSYRKDNVLLIPGVPFFSSIENTRHQAVVRVKTYGIWIYHTALPNLRLVFRMARTFIWALTSFARLPVYYFGKNRKKETTNLHEPSVAVEYTWGIYHNGKSDLYWYDESWLPPDRVLFYFDRRSRVPLTRQLANELERRGFRWIVENASACLIDNEPVWRSTPWAGLKQFSWILRFVWNARKWRLSKTFGEHVWTMQSIIRMLHNVSYWSDFFAANNIVGNTNISGMPSITHLDQTLGLHLANGCNFRITHSYHSTLNGTEVGDYHLFFSWGRCSGSSGRVIPYLSNSANVILTGYPFDRFFHTKSESDLRLQSCLKPRDGSIFVIAAFDEAFDKIRSDISPCIWHFFYEALARWALRRNDVLVAFKSKMYNTEEIVEQVPVVGVAIQAGCTVVVDKTVPPYRVAGSANLAIGLGVYTAAIEAVLYGIPALHYDPGHRICEQLIDRVSTKLVYREMKHLLEQVEGLIEGGDLNNLGSHEEILDEIDPFRDGKAGNRIGEYLLLYLESVDKGLSRDEAINRANEIYMGKWGKDKVIVNSGIYMQQAAN